LKLEYIFEGLILIIIGVTGFYVGNILFFNPDIIFQGIGFGAEYISGLTAIYSRVLGIICVIAGILLLTYTLTIQRSEGISKKIDYQLSHKEILFINNR
jgi:hypothetical protein